VWLLAAFEFGDIQAEFKRLRNLGVACKGVRTRDR
jgi:hypothetical protein